MKIKTEHFSPNKEISVTINIHCLFRLHQFLLISTVDDTENVSYPHQSAQLLCVYPWTQHNLSKPGPWFGIILLRSDRDDVSDIVASAIFSILQFQKSTGPLKNIVKYSWLIKHKIKLGKKVDLRYGRYYGGWSWYMTLGYV